MTDDTETLIKDIMNHESKLTEWEHNFMQAVSESTNISKRQTEIIGRIWEKVTL